MTIRRVLSIISKFYNAKIDKLTLVILVHAIFFSYLFFWSKLPQGLNHDGAWSGIYASRILNSEPFTFYVKEEYGQETLYHYSLAAAIYLFGISTKTFIIAGYFWSVITVIGFHLLVKKIFKNKITTLISSFLFSISGPLFVYAVSGWRLITLIAITPYILLAYYNFIKKPNKINSLIAGVLSALPFYTYSAGRSQIFVLLILIIAHFFSKKQKNIFQKIKLATLVIFGFAVTISPMAVTAIGDYDAWMGRFNSFNSEKNYFENITHSLTYFNINANGNDFYINFPVLEGPVAIMWLLGLMATIVTFKKNWFWPVIFPLYLLPSVLSQPSFHRACGSLILIYLFIAFFIDYVVKSRMKLSTAILIIIMFLQLFFTNKKMVINKQPFGLGFYPEPTILAEYIKQKSIKNPTIIANNWPDTIITFILIDNKKMSLEKKYEYYQDYTSDDHNGLQHFISKNQQKSDSQLVGTYIVSNQYLNGFLVYFNKKESLSYREIDKLRFNSQVFGTVVEVKK